MPRTPTLKSRRGPTGEAPPRWKPLDYEEISECLKSGGLTRCGPGIVKGLTNGVNAAVHQANRMHPKGGGHLPHMRIKRLDQLLRLLDGVLSALAVDEGLAFEVDKKANRPPNAIRSVREFRSRFPEATDLELRASAEMGIVFPSAEAADEVRLAIAGVRWLRGLAEARRNVIVQLQNRQENKRKPRKADILRYWLIAQLAASFSELLGARPTLTLGGPWISFLAAVLARCERRDDLSQEAARSIWRETLDWSGVEFATKQKSKS
jgi:hypothetical protein